jgi:hypothetical protein
MPAQTKTYRDLRDLSYGTGFLGAGLHVVTTSAGLLVLEEHSSVEGLPSSLWILYEAPATKSKGANKP